MWFYLFNNSAVMVVIELKCFFMFCRFFWLLLLRVTADRKLQFNWFYWFNWLGTRHFCTQKSSLCVCVVDCVLALLSAPVCVRRHRHTHTHTNTCASMRVSGSEYNKPICLLKATNFPPIPEAVELNQQVSCFEPVSWSKCGGVNRNTATCLMWL